MMEPSPRRKSSSAGQHFENFYVFYERLQKLECPIVPGSGEWTPKLVYYADGGDLRLKLIEWLFQRISSDISCNSSNTVLGSERGGKRNASGSERIDSFINDLFYWGVQLGLCREGDEEIISGKCANLYRCIRFFDELSLNALIGDKAGSEGLRERLNKSARLTKALISNGNLENIFNSECTLFPPDMMLSTNNEYRSSSPLGPKITSTENENLQNIIRHLSDKLMLSEASYKEAKEQMPQGVVDGANDIYAEEDCSTSKAVKKLIHTCASFNNVFKKEMEAWTKNDAGASYDELGYCYEKINTSLVELQENLNNIKNIKEVYSFFQNDATKSDTAEGQKFLESKAQELKGYISVLHKRKMLLAAD
eukprot:Nk52_evm91s207 gene=Nk52_evmTU91s207